MTDFCKHIGIVTVAFASLAGLIPSVTAADHGVILVYHHVATDTPYSTSISPQYFRQHMTYLKVNDFNVMPLTDMVDALRQGRQVPEKSVAITFDDGYASVYSNAYPLLRAMGYSFTVFINTLPIDQYQPGYMNWAQLREMSDSGVLLGNHTKDHPYLLTQLEGETAAEHLQRLGNDFLLAEARIKTQTGQSNRLLAYPYGEYDTAIKSLVAELGFTGFGQNSGAIARWSDFQALPRFPLAGDYADLDTASVKFSTRAFRITEQQPESPVTGDLSPTLHLRFEKGDYDLDSLQCFAAGQPVAIEWLDRSAGLIKINPSRVFTTRRWLYTCTAPVSNSRDYYWYSAPWVYPNRNQLVN